MRYRDRGRDVVCLGHGIAATRACHSKRHRVGARCTIGVGRVLGRTAGAVSERPVVGVDASSRRACEIDRQRRCARCFVYRKA